MRLSSWLTSGLSLLSFESSLSSCTTCRNSCSAERQRVDDLSLHFLRGSTVCSYLRVTSNVTIPARILPCTDLASTEISICVTRQLLLSARRLNAPRRRQRAIRALVAGSLRIGRLLEVYLQFRRSPCLLSQLKGTSLNSELEHKLTRKFCLEGDEVEAYSYSEQVGFGETAASHLL